MSRHTCRQKTISHLDTVIVLWLWLKGLGKQVFIMRHRRAGDDCTIAAAITSAPDAPEGLGSSNENFLPLVVCSQNISEADIFPQHP